MQIEQYMTNRIKTTHRKQRLKTREVIMLRVTLDKCENLAKEIHEKAVKIHRVIEQK